MILQHQDIDPTVVEDKPFFSRSQSRIQQFPASSLAQASLIFPLLHKMSSSPGAHQKDHESESTAQASASATKPIDIQSARNVQHVYAEPMIATAPQLTRRDWTAPSFTIRPFPRAEIDESYKEVEAKNEAKVVLPNKARSQNKSSVHGRNDLHLYRERILSEAMRRGVQEAGKEGTRLSRQESDKENNVANGKDYNAYEGTSVYVDGLTNAMEEEKQPFESVQAECRDRKTSITSCSSHNFWDADDEIPQFTEFHSVADIIGYAKVVRAQRNETLGKLNSVIGEFSNVWSTLRKEMELAKMAAGATIIRPQHPNLS